MSYREQLLKHLGDYKTQVLGVYEDGVWRKNGRHYPHILPEALKKLNILEGIRKSFWCDFNRRRFGSLHPDFHHLNSSQAMCFNLFYPFVASSNLYTDVLFQSMGCSVSHVQEWKFEYIANTNENTHFDFYMLLENGTELFFEVKLSESGFGGGKKNLRRDAKLETIYAPMLNGKVKACYLDPEVFFVHYQLFRNISYITLDGRSVFFLVIPRSNPSISNEVCLLDDMLEPQVRDHVRIIWLEGLIAEMRSSAHENALIAHLDAFDRKYLLKKRI
jgi:hypothetical protein